MTRSQSTTEQSSPNGARPVSGNKPTIDPFDPARFRVDPLADIEVEKVLTTVPVRKPKLTEFFRVHSGRDFTVDMYLLEREDGMDRESYLVDPKVQHLVLSELRQVRLFTAISNTATFSCGRFGFPPTIATASAEWPTLLLKVRSRPKTYGSS